MLSLRPRPRSKFRRNGYKIAVDAGVLRRRRENNMMEIRKISREESLLKKRQEGSQSQSLLTLASPAASSIKLESFPAMIANVWSEDVNLQLLAIAEFRRLLSIELVPPIIEVIQAGVVPQFVQFLMKEDFPQLQFEAAWALTNIAFGTSEHTNVVIDNGVVPILVKLLGSPSDEVKEHVVWALGNVAGDSPGCRDFVLANGALLPLLTLLNDNAKLSMLHNATWTLSNLCRGKPQPPFDQMNVALPTLTRLIHSTDEEVLGSVCFALSYISVGDNYKIQRVIDSGVVPRLAELLQRQSTNVLFSALQTIGNLASGDDVQTQFIIDHKALTCLLPLLTGNYIEVIRKKGCWTFSNITARNREQVQAVIESGIFGPLIDLLSSAEFEIKNEAAWAVSNATSTGCLEQIKFLVNQGCIKPLCNLLTCPDPETVTVCLEGLENILKAGEIEKEQGSIGGVNLYAQLIDEVEGLEKTENLLNHDNTEIYGKAEKILETYWFEGEEEEAIMALGVTQPCFTFGATNNLANGEGNDFHFN